LRSQAPKAKRAVFLDRDGTLNVDTGFVAHPEDVRLVSGAAEGAKRLAQAGYVLVITSNQSGIARGILTEEQADAVDRKLLDLLRDRGVGIEAIYRCPHLPDGANSRFAVVCDCRKPKPGLLLRAAADLGLDLASSWAVGDSERDVQAGLAAGCRAILLDGTKTVPTGASVAKDLLEAASIIMEKS
jgi:D-glycero-D-manno-heptose 1,7-bisphosphate phosphatase